MATTDQLLDLDGVGQVSYSFRFDELNELLEKTGTLRPAGAVTITNDTSRPIQRTASGLTILTPPGGETYNPKRKRVRIQMVLENGAVLPCGTFVFTSGDNVLTNDGTEFRGELMDLGFLVDQKSTQSYGVPKGAVIETVIGLILSQQGIVDRSIQTSGTRVGTPIGWPANTSWLTIINELAALAGCLPLHFDALGQARIRLIPSVETDPIDVTYRDNGNIFNSGILESGDALTAPNLFVAIENGGSGALIVGTYLLPPDAPNSVYETGITIPEVFYEQGMQDVYTANERARLEALTKGSVEGRRWDSPADPRHGSYAIVDFRGERFLEDSWSMVCEYGENMSHTASKAYTG